LVIETDDLQGDIEALGTRGLKIAGGVQDAPWGRFVTFDDPDGNGIVLQATASRA
jgi:predicted enzyme related to lactoylglutathione lyase